VESSDPMRQPRRLCSSHKQRASSDESPRNDQVRTTYHRMAGQANEYSQGKSDAPPPPQPHPRVQSAPDRKVRFPTRTRSTCVHLRSRSIDFEPRPGPSQPCMTRACSEMTMAFCKFRVLVDGVVAAHVALKTTSPSCPGMSTSPSPPAGATKFSTSDHLCRYASVSLSLHPPLSTPIELDTHTRQPVSLISPPSPFIGRRNMR
jgi:hypothetical protein